MCPSIGSCHVSFKHPIKIKERGFFAKHPVKKIKERGLFAKMKRVRCFSWPIMASHLEEIFWWKVGEAWRSWWKEKETCGGRKFLYLYTWTYKYLCIHWYIHTRIILV